MSAQGSRLWLLERAGHATASRFGDILARVKTGEAATRRNYRIQLVTERLIAAPVETYQNAAMQWGTEQEPVARASYEEVTGRIVSETGFLRHPQVEWVGASPDGLIGDDGGLEIKCPYVSTVHVETWLAGDVPAEHLPQIQGCMWVTGRKWWDFVSFDPRMPAHLRLFVKRVERDEKYIQHLAAEVEKFLGEVASMVTYLEAGLTDGL